MPAKGIYAAVVTPVEPGGAISVERYCRHARWLLRQGCTGLGVFGTTSETQAFSVAERQAGLEAYVAAVKRGEFSNEWVDRMLIADGCLFEQE